MTAWQKRLVNKIGFVWRLCAIAVADNAMDGQWLEKAMLLTIVPVGYACGRWLGDDKTQQQETLTPVACYQSALKCEFCRKEYRRGFRDGRKFGPASSYSEDEHYGI